MVLFGKGIRYQDNIFNNGIDLVAVPIIIMCIFFSFFLLKLLS